MRFSQCWVCSQPSISEGDKVKPVDGLCLDCAKSAMEAPEVPVSMEDFERYRGFYRLIAAAVDEGIRRNEQEED